MDVTPLIEQARVSGLTLFQRDGQLVIRGPESLEALALAILEHKAEVIAYFQQQCLLSCAPCTCPPSLVCLKLFSDGCEKCGSVRCYLCLGCMRARRIALELNQPGQDMQSE
jgi:hypothetical protein